MTNSTILIVDDEVDILTLLDLELSLDGYTVLKASNGPEAIRKTKMFMPDLVILDVLMPDMNGGQVLQELKSDERTRNIPIIFLTAVLSKTEEKSKKLGVGIDHVFYPAIAKPIDVKEFLEEIGRLLPKAGKNI